VSNILSPLLAVALVVAGLLVARGDATGRPASGAPVDGARYRLTAGAARDAGVRRLPAPAPLRFAAGVAPGDRRAVLDAIAAARPEARRLVALVAGLVTIAVRPLGAGHAGETRSAADGYDVVLDLAGVFGTTGLRGMRRVALHELAHVVDDALVAGALERRLDAATPAGIGCDGGVGGGCAPRAERFAESFAKWATGDIGADLLLGYRVPPPLSVSEWGAPLAVLKR
jgi:hypothetical protein